MSSVQHKLDARVLRVGRIGDTFNFFCQVEAEQHRQVVISISADAMPHRHTRAMISLIQANDLVFFNFTTDTPDEHGIRRVRMLHDVRNKHVRPDGPDYGVD